MFEEDKAPTWLPGSSVYLRHTPYPFDWLVLLIMCTLDFVNQVIFKDVQKANLLSKKCYENIRDEYTDLVFFIQSIKNAMSRYVLAFTVIVMFYVIGKA